MDTAVNKKIRLVELGPGKGTLMADILRVCEYFLTYASQAYHKYQVFSAFPKAKAALASIHLVEMSSPMRKLQESALSPFSSAGVEITWSDTLEEVQDADEGTFTMLVAHEFFDVLPVHVLQVSSFFCLEM